MQTSEITSIATVIGSVFVFLGYTGIDASVISSAITGIISLVTIGTAVYTHIAHKNLVAQQ